MDRTESTRQDVVEDDYEAPELTSYGTIEEWTRGVSQIDISIII